MSKKPRFTHDDFMTRQEVMEEFFLTRVLLDSMVECGALHRRIVKSKHYYRRADLEALSPYFDQLPSEKGVVYFIRATTVGLIKIGRARNLKRRHAAIQSSNADKVELLGWIKGGKIHEYWVHQCFADARSHGEWFKPTDELMAWISEHTTTEME